MKVVAKSATGNWDQLLGDMKNDDENSDDVSGVTGDGGDIMLVYHVSSKNSLGQYLLVSDKFLLVKNFSLFSKLILPNHKITFSF